MALWCGGGGGLGGVGRGGVDKEREFLFRLLDIIHQGKLNTRDSEPEQRKI